MQQKYHLMCGHCDVESFTYESVTNVTYELASPDLQSRHESGRKKGREILHLACTHGIPTFLSYLRSQTEDVRSDENRGGLELQLGSELGARPVCFGIPHKRPLINCRNFP